LLKLASPPTCLVGQLPFEDADVAGELAHAGDEGRAEMVGFVIGQIAAN